MQRGVSQEYLVSTLDETRTFGMQKVEDDMEVLSGLKGEIVIVDVLHGLC